MHSLLHNRVFKNASWIIGCRIAQMIINLLVGMLTARYLGPSNYGILNYASSITAFAVPIMQLGLNNILVQEIINHPKSEGMTLGSAILMSTCSSVLCLVGVFAFVYIANEGETETLLVCALYSLILVFQAFELIIYWFQAKLLSKYTSILSFSAYIVVAIYKIMLLVTKQNVYWFAVSSVLDSALIAVGCLILYRALGGKKLTFSKETAWRMLSRSHFYIVSNMMVTIFAQTDKIMIKMMMDNSQTGYYSAAITCAHLSNFVFTAIIDSMRPTVFESRKRSLAIYENRLTLLYSIVFYLSLTQCVFMTTLAKPLIRILYGVQYLPATSALQIGVWYTTFSYLGAVRNIWILAENKQKYLWIINLCGASANVLLNYLLIPIWGINGAAIASLFTQFFTNVIIGYIIKPIRPNNSIMIRAMNPRTIVFLVRDHLYEE